MASRNDVRAFKDACQQDIDGGVNFLFFEYFPKGEHDKKIEALAEFVAVASPLCGGASFQTPQTVETIINCLPASAEKSALQRTAKFFGLV